MISDAEQQKLVEIEMVLRRDDPAYVRHFDKRTPTPRMRHVLAILAILVVSAVTAVAVVVGGIGPTIIGPSVMGGIAIAFRLWRRRVEQPRRMR